MAGDFSDQLQLVFIWCGDEIVAHPIRSGGPADIMQVEIGNKGFNLFDQVIVAGREIIANGVSRGIILQGEGGGLYNAAKDPESRVVIEENGPVRSVVRIDGNHVENGRKMLDYTVRMHFYKWKSQVKIYYTLRNADKDQFEHAYLTSLDLITKVSSDKKLTVSVSTHKGVLQEKLSESSGSLVYYQAVSDFPQKYEGDSFYYHAPIPPDYTREKERGFVQEGYWIWQNGNELVRGEKDD